LRSTAQMMVDDKVAFRVDVAVVICHALYALK
jgi:hypothetical protein